MCHVIHNFNLITTQVGSHSDLATLESSLVLFKLCQQTSVISEFKFLADFSLFVQKLIEYLTS